MWRSSLINWGKRRKRWTNVERLSKHSCAVAETNSARVSLQILVTNSQLKHKRIQANFLQLKTELDALNLLSLWKWSGSRSNLTCLLCTPSPKLFPPTASGTWAEQRLAKVMNYGEGIGNSAWLSHMPLLRSFGFSGPCSQVQIVAWQLLGTLMHKGN